MADPKFIVVNKVIKDKTGAIKKSAETIRLDLVRSARPWKKTHEEELAIEEDITVLYMIPESDEKNKRPRIGQESKDAKVKIAESKDNWDRRTGAIQLLDAEVKKLGE